MSFWWNSVADIALSQFETWKNNRRSEGVTISHQPITTSGFPYRVKLYLTDVRIVRSHTDTQSGFKIIIPNIWALTQPWNPTHIIFGTLGTSEYNPSDDAGAQTFSLTPETAMGSATFSSEGKFKTLAIDITKAQMQTSQYGPLSADRLQLHSRMSVTLKKTEGSDAPASAAENPAWQIALRADVITFENGAVAPLGGTNCQSQYFNNC